MAKCIAQVFYFVYFHPVKQIVNYSLQICHCLRFQMMTLGWNADSLKLSPNYFLKKFKYLYYLNNEVYFLRRHHITLAHHRLQDSKILSPCNVLKCYHFKLLRIQSNSFTNN